MLRGGRLVDPASGALRAVDVLIRDGRIAAIDAGLQTPPESTELQLDGALLAPGFIDLHTHVFSHPLFRNSRLQADRIGVRQGVACVVDAGSSGAATIDAFPQFVHATQATRVYAFINIGSPGLPNLGGGHASRPELLDLPGVVKAFERHGDWLVGVKVLASASHTGAFGLEAVKMARKAAELAGRPLMLHVGNAPPVIDDVLDLLRPGDIVTHTYHGKPGGVLTYGDGVLPAFREAVARGVVVDIGHGRASFSFRVAERALEAGMPVHCISSDLHRGNVDRYAVSLARTMSKLLALGMSLPETLAAVTSTPAAALGLDARGIGTLAVGGPADITAFDLVDCDREVEDAEGERRTLRQWIEPRHVWVGGQHHAVDAPL